MKKEEKKEIEKDEDDSECGCGLATVLIAVLCVLGLFAILVPDNEPDCFYREALNSRDGITGLFRTIDVACPK